MSDLLGRKLERLAQLQGGTSAELVRQLAREGVFFLCEECGAFVGQLARSRHAYEHSYQREIDAERERIRLEGVARLEAWQRDHPGRMRVVPVPVPDDPIAARPSKTPLYHRIVVEPGRTSTVRFFRDVTWGSTNLSGAGGHLPAGHHFYAYGLSVIPDEGTDKRSVAAIRNQGQVLFLRGGDASQPPTHITHALPTVATVNTRRFLTSDVVADLDEEALVGLVPMHPLTISGMPVELPALQSFSVDLHTPAWIAGPPVGLTCILHGLMLSGVHY